MSRRMPRRKGMGNRGGRTNQGGAVKILSFATGTFTRASDGYYFPTAASLGKVGSNVLRTLDAPDGVTGTLFEGSRTNLLLRSEEFDDAVWAKTGVTVTPNAVSSPFGDTTADQLDFLGLATDSISQADLAPPNSTIVAGGIWLRTASGTLDLRIRFTNKAGTNTDTAITVTSSWQFFPAGQGNTGTGTTCTFALISAASPAAGTVYAWGAQYAQEVGAAGPSSYIKTEGASATRAADSLTWADGSWNPTAFNRPWYMEFAPYSSSGNASRTLVCFRDVNNAIFILSSNRIRVVIASSVVVESNVLTYSRHQKMRVTFNPAAGSITVTGATAGNGTVVGTPWTTPTGFSFRAGGIVSSASEFYGRLWEPYAA